MKLLINKAYEEAWTGGLLYMPARQEDWVDTEENPALTNELEEAGWSHNSKLYLEPPPEVVVAYVRKLNHHPTMTPQVYLDSLKDVDTSTDKLQKRPLRAYRLGRPAAVRGQLELKSEIRKPRCAASKGKHVC